MRPGLATPARREALGAALGERVPRRCGATCVLSPALGGIVIGQEVGARVSMSARSLPSGRRNRPDTAPRLLALPADKVLVVEDVVTTAGSTRETMAVAQQHGAQVVGACSIVDRSGGGHGLDLPYAALLEMSFPTYAESGCPLCKEAVPVTKPGSRGAA